VSDVVFPDADPEPPEAELDFEADPVEAPSEAGENQSEPAPTEEVAEGDTPPKRKRRKRRSPPKSPAHEARIAQYRALVETRGWIFAPPTPERPISYLFDDLTVKQIVTLSTPDREMRRRA
jgi:hypothetical protein